MPTIPSLTTWGPTGTITATVVNNNFSTIRTYVNTYCAFLDQDNTFTGTTQTFPAIVATSGTFSGTLQGAGSIQSVAGGVTGRLAADSGNSWVTIGTYSNHNLKFVSNSVTRGQLTAGGTFELDTITAVTLTATGTTTLGATGTGALTCTTLAPSGASTLQAVTCTTLAPSSTTTLSATGATYALDLTGAAPRIRVANNGTLTFVENDGSTAIMTLTESTRAVAFGGAVSVTGIVTCSTDVATGPATALASSATAGFLWIPATNGVPAGTPSPEYGDRIALTYNYSANALYAYNPTDNTWRAV